MENVIGVTSYLRKKMVRTVEIGQRDSECHSGCGWKPYFIDYRGEYWRSYKFVTDASSYDQVEKPEDFYQSAYAFGNFPETSYGLSGRQSA